MKAFARSEAIKKKGLIGMQVSGYTDIIFGKKRNCECSENYRLRCHCQLYINVELTAKFNNLKLFVGNSEMRLIYRGKQCLMGKSRSIRVLVHFRFFKSNFGFLNSFFQRLWWISSNKLNPLSNNWSFHPPSFMKNMVT